MRTGAARMTAAVLGCLLVAGCSAGGDPAPEDPSTSQPPSSPAPSGSEEATPGPSAAGSGETDPSETEESEQASASPRASAAASSEVPVGYRSLAIEQRHPNGSVLRLTGLTVEPTAIRVELEVVNGSGDAFGLAPGGAVVSLSDDLGGVYEFIEPADNPDLEIAARGTLTGELVYFGVLPPEVATLRLQTNASTRGADATLIYDPATESANEPFPHFSVEIPLAP